jgi:hypothetical protein
MFCTAKTMGRTFRPRALCSLPFFGIDPFPACPRPTTADKPLNIITLQEEVMAINLVHIENDVEIKQSLEAERICLRKSQGLTNPNTSIVRLSAPSRLKNAIA